MDVDSTQYQALWQQLNRGYEPNVHTSIQSVPKQLYVQAAVMVCPVLGPRSPEQGQDSLHPLVSRLSIISPPPGTPRGEAAGQI
eukprot:3841355-Amphidinium_carterae.2